MVKSLIQKAKRELARQKAKRKYAQIQRRALNTVSTHLTDKDYNRAYIKETRKIRIAKAQEDARRKFGITTNAPKQSFNQLSPLGSLGTSTKPTRKAYKIPKQPRTKYVVVDGKAYPVGYQKPKAKKPTLKTAKKIAGPMDKSYSLFSKDQGFNKGVARKRGGGIY